MRVTICSGWAAHDFFLDLQRLVGLFPDAKCIYIARDGRDVALSLLEKSWGPGNVYACAEYWKACNAESAALAGPRARRQLFEVTYEALLDDSRSVVGRMHAFLEEPLPEAALRPLLESVQPGNRNKWTTRLTATDVRLFERVAANILERLGYASTRQERGVGAASATIYRLQDRMHTVAHLMRTNTIDAVRIRYFGREPFAD